MVHIWNEDYVKWIDNNISTKELTENQIVFLRNLNNKLVEIEGLLITEVIKLTEIGDSRLVDPNDWIDDYEIECRITFILNENDPDFKEDDDNILIELDGECYKHQDRDTSLLDDGDNYNEYKRLDHPISKEHHCYLFHTLDDHTGLGWSNILRIGLIWLDVNIIYQKFTEFSKVIF